MHVNSPVWLTPTSSSSIASVRVAFGGQISKVLGKFLSLRGSASHLALVCCVINTAKKTKSGVFACFKGRGGKREGRGALTEMRSVGDGTLRMQQNEAVFIKKPSETPYYENLAEEGCASEATLWTRCLERKEHSSLCQADRAGRRHFTSKTTAKSESCDGRTVVGRPTACF